MADRRETRYPQSGDAYIAYQTLGSGPTTLLMSSYGTISVDAFDDEPHFVRFTEGLASFARIIRYDRRGVGLSDPIEPSA
ncbi:MAG: adenylate/guanylate cyclase domain-containing protein, partial [Acidimicrobiia bacterium]